VTSGSKGSARCRGRDRSGRDARLRLARRGLRVDQRDESFSTDCAAHSYGQVQQFFREHPCTALFRAIYEVGDRRGNGVLVAVAWVDMPDEAQAAAYQRLVDRQGTGNIVELSKQRRRYRNVHFTGRYYASLRDRITVVNGQAEPLSGAAASATLAEAVAREVG
jgi:hypothetical protein